MGKGRRRSMVATAGAVAVMLLALARPAGATPAPVIPPAPANGVADLHHDLPADGMSLIQLDLATENGTAKVHVAVDVVDDADTGGLPIDTYAAQVFASWNVGRGTGNGVLLVADTDSQQASIQAGPVAARIFTPAVITRIVDSNINPYLGLEDEGVTNGLAAMGKALGIPQALVLGDGPPPTLPANFGGSHSDTGRNAAIVLAVLIAAVGAVYRLRRLSRRLYRWRLRPRTPDRFFNGDGSDAGQTGGDGGSMGNW